MKETIGTIDPEALVTAYNEETSPGARIQRLWDDFGEASITCIANGARCTGEIWESAWAEGGGPNIPDSKLKAISKDVLANIYRPQIFLPSRAL